MFSSVGSEKRRRFHRHVGRLRRWTADTVPELFNKFFMKKSAGRFPMSQKRDMGHPATHDETAGRMGHPAPAIEVEPTPSTQIYYGR
jgi:hypothetical protein